MGKLDGFTSREVRKVAESLGWNAERTRGSHVVFTHPGSPLNLSVPAHRDVKAGLLRSIITKMGLTVDEFLDLAKK